MNDELTEKKAIPKYMPVLFVCIGTVFMIIALIMLATYFIPYQAEVPTGHPMEKYELFYVRQPDDNIVSPFDSFLGIPRTLILAVSLIVGVLSLLISMSLHRYQRENQYAFVHKPDGGISSLTPQDIERLDDWDEFEGQDDQNTLL